MVRSGDIDKLPGKDAGTVFVAEMVDIDDVGRMSGLFTAHWEIEEGQRSIDGPEDVALDEALAWGRARSDAVLVQVGCGVDGFYSAGVRDMTYGGEDDDDPEPILPWPDEGLDIAPRPMQTALDGSEQIVLWRAHCRLNVQPEEWAQVVARLLENDLVVRVDKPTDPGGTVDLIVRGEGVTAVFIPLYRLIERTLVSVGVDPDKARVDMHMGSPDERVLD